MWTGSRPLPRPMQSRPPPLSGHTQVKEEDDDDEDDDEDVDEDDGSSDEDEEAGRQDIL